MKQQILIYLLALFACSSFAQPTFRASISCGVTSLNNQTDCTGISNNAGFYLVDADSKHLSTFFGASISEVDFAQDKAAYKGFRAGAEFGVEYEIFKIVLSCSGIQEVAFASKQYGYPESSDSSKLDKMRGGFGGTFGISKMLSKRVSVSAVYYSSITETMAGKRLCSLRIGFAYAL